MGTRIDTSTTPPIDGVEAGAGAPPAHAVAPDTGPTRPTGGFARLWTATAAANLGDGILLAALPVLATLITTRPGPVAAVTTLFFTGMLIAALPSGVLADRGDRRKVLVVSDAVRSVGILIGLVVVATDIAPLAGLMGVALLVGSTESLNDVTTETAVPEMVEPGRLARAHGRLTSTQLVMNDGVGAPLGGLLATMGVGAALAVPAALYAIAGVIVAGVTIAHGPDRRRAADRSPSQDLTEGLVTLRRDGLLARAATASMFLNLASTAFFSVAVLLVIGPMGLPRSAYGLILTAVAVGGVAGGVLAEPVIERLGAIRVLRVTPVAIIVSYAVICAFPTPWVAVPALVGLAACGMVTNVNSRVLRQRRTPAGVLGRVATAMRLLSLGAAPVGGVLGGVVAEAWGVRAVGVVTAVAGLIALAVVWTVADGSEEPTVSTARP